MSRGGETEEGGAAVMRGMKDNHIPRNIIRGIALSRYQRYLVLDGAGRKCEIRPECDDGVVTYFTRAFADHVTLDICCDSAGYSLYH